MLNHLFNLFGYNPSGREGPDKAGREEGYLFWIAWLQHNGAALFSTADANGPFRPVSLGGTCGVLKSLAGENPPLNQTLLPALTDPSSAGALMQKQAPSPRLDPRSWSSSRCRASGCCSSCGCSFGGPIPLKPKGYEFKVAFPEATQLGLEADVRVAGVSVGKVRAKGSTAPTPTARWRRIELDRKYAPIAATRRRSCARRRCWGRPTSS